MYINMKRRDGGRYGSTIPGEGHIYIRKYTPTHTYINMFIYQG